MMKPWLKTLRVAGVTCAVTAVVLATLPRCTTAQDDDGDELQDEDMQLSTPWSDLLGQKGDDRLHLRRPATISPERYFPATLSQPMPYAGGTFGLIGPAKAFVASTSVVKDDSELYRVMVKVLSEKFSCMMTAKQKQDDETWVQCRDGRHVHFWRDQDADWVQFQARQYDPSGYEIVVRKHQIQRIGGMPQLLPRALSESMVQTSEPPMR